ncbi:hypothetical protein LPJ63_004214 [Coemansia sp. RSA 2711]|nr:hypothetical protein LPJ63_004214 [Coemansia sp. RSA 2711]
MSFRNTEFQQACLAWISGLSNERIEGTADLVDGRILIDVTTEADPEYFAAASLVLPSHAGEPNLDALAQLARLLLRYFDQGLGKQLTRDYVPGVHSLTAAPFDDLWRLLVLVVSVTLLSERNESGRVYEGMDKATQTRLRLGIDGMWGDEQLQQQQQASLIDLDAGSESDRNKSSTEARRLAPPPASVYTTSNDSVQTSLLQFQSAYSSLPSQSQHSEHAAEAVIPMTASVQRSAHEPALLPITEGSQSLGTIASTIGGGRYNRSMVGFAGSEDSSSDGEEEEAAGLSDTDSYVSEFSQDLAEYGPDVVSVGFNGPNAFAAYLYIANMVAYIATGGYLLLSTSVPQRKSPYFKDYYDMTTAILKVLLYSAVSAAISIGWVQLLRLQTRKVIWMTTLSVPVVGVATAVWAGTQMFRIPGAEELIGFRVRNGIVIAVSLILAVRFVWSISQRKQDIERSVDIVKLACTVLMQNKELYAFSLLLLAFYGSFAMGSAVFATRLPLLLGDGSVLAGSRHSWGVAGYLLATFAWTSAVFVQLLRAVVSSVVCQWYFHRHDPHEPPALHTLQAATVSALTHQFGTVVVCATLLFVAKTLHLVELLLRWCVSVLRVVPVSLVSLVVGRPIYLAEGWSSYTAVYAAFTGKGFWESSRTVTRLLQRHHLLHSPVVSLIKSSMTCYALLLSVVFGYALGLQALSTLSLHSAFVAVAGSAMPFALLQLVTHVLSCTVEALVVCYAIDLEVESCHSINVVEAMSLV